MNVLLRVTDAGRSLSFYRELGFREELLFRKDGRLYYGEMTFTDPALGALMFLEREWWLADSGDQAGGSVGQVLYFRTDDVDAIRARVAEAAVVRGPKDEYYGRELLLRDPDGHQLAFLQTWPGGERLPPGVDAWRRG